MKKATRKGGFFELNSPDGELNCFAAKLTFGQLNVCLRKRKGGFPPREDLLRNTSETTGLVGNHV